MAIREFFVDLVKVHGDVTAVEANFLAVNFDTVTTPPAHIVGHLHWSSDDGTLTLGMPNDVELQIGQEAFFYVKNQSGSTITDGTPVMFNGSVGASGRIVVEKAIADGTVPAESIVGIMTQDLTTGNDGFSTWFGKVRGIQTNGANYGETWAVGDILYVSAATAGYLTKTKPAAPNLVISVAVVIVAHATVGTLLVRPTWNPILEDLSNVNGTTALNNHVLAYDSAGGYWDATAITESMITDLGPYDNYNNWKLRDGDTTVVTMLSGQQINLIEGGNVNINWTDTTGPTYGLTISATNTNQLTTFNLTGDSGTNQLIEQGSTLDIAGDGTAISTVVGATDTVTINHSTADGFKHIPAGGVAEQWLKWSALGEASWEDLSSIGTNTPFILYVSDAITIIASENNNYTFSNSSGDFDITLPAAPTAGAYFDLYTHSINSLNITNTISSGEPTYATGGLYRVIYAGLSQYYVVTLNEPSAGVGSVTEVSSTTTGQLTVANPNTTPALTIVTAAVANAGTALATGDQIYDFVTGLGYTSNIGDITGVNITAGTGLTGSVNTASGQHTQTINLSAATTTVRGGIELESATVGNTANAITSTASRTYGLQVNAAGQGVINVPWTDTDNNTTYTASDGVFMDGTNVEMNILNLTNAADGVNVAGDSIVYYDLSLTRHVHALMSEVNLGAFKNDQNWTNNTGDITNVSAGTGMTGGGASGSVTLNVIGGNGITANANDIEIDFTDFGTLSTGTGLTGSSYNGSTSPVAWAIDYLGADNFMFSAPLLTSPATSDYIIYHDITDSNVKKALISSLPFTNNAAANNATITLSAGSGLITGGAFTTNQSANETISTHVGEGYGILVGTNDVAVEYGSKTPTNNVIQAASLVNTGTHPTMVGVDSMIFNDDGTGLVWEAKFNTIPLSIFSNDLGITSPNNNTITLSAGTGVSGGGAFTTNQSFNETITFTLDFGELGTGGTLVSTDYLLAENGGVDNRQLISAIPLGIFNNDQGWTNNVGTISNITVGTGLDITTSTGPTAAITVDLSEFTAINNTTLTTADYLIVLDGTVERKITFANTKLSLFDNDLAGTTYTGTAPIVVTGTVISHTAYSSTNINTSGATIVDIITTNSTGHVTALGTRTLTLANLGYTGSATANDYTHPNHSGHVTSTGDGATVVTVDAIDDQTTGTVLAGADKFLYSDNGVIKNITTDTIAGFMDNNLNFMNSWTIKEGNGTESTTVTDGETLTISDGNGILSELTSTTSGGTIDISIDYSDVGSYTGQQGTAMVTTHITSTSSTAWNLNTQQVRRITTANSPTITISNPSNPIAGHTYVLMTKNNDAANILWGTNYLFPGGVAPDLTQGKDALDVFTFIYDGTNMLCTSAKNFS